MSVTCQPLSKRMQKHRSSMKNGRGKGTKLCQKMNELGVRNFYIELYQEYACENIEQLRQREGEVIRELQPTLDTRIESRTVKEYREDNTDKLQAWNKQYREERKE